MLYKPPPIPPDPSVNDRINRGNYQLKEYFFLENLDRDVSSPNFLIRIIDRGSILGGGKTKKEEG